MIRLWAGGLAVLERDFLATTSQKRFLALRLGVALISAIVVGVIAVDSRRADPDTIGRAVFVAAAFVVPLLIALVAPATSAPSIASEREGGTLDLVLVAPVRPFTFVTAKFLSRFLAIATLIFAATPVAAVSLFFGGVPLETFGALILLALCFAALGVAAGVLMSAFFRSVTQALLAAYLLVLGGPMVPAAILEYAAKDLNWPRVREFAHWLRPAYPAYAWGQLTMAGMGHGGDPETVYWHTLSVAVVVGSALLIAAWKVGRGTTGSRGARRKRLSQGVFLEHPIIDRGVRGSLLSHPTITSLGLPMIGLFVVGATLWPTLEYPRSVRSESAIMPLGILTLLGMLRMLAATSGSIASERRRGSLDLLMATPLRSEEIALGTLAGSLLAGSPLLIIGVVHATICMGLGAFTLLGLFGWLVISTSLLLFTGALGLRASISARSPTHAALRTFGIFFGAVVGVCLVLFLMAVSGFGGDAIEYVAITLPVVLPFYGSWTADSLSDLSSGSVKLGEFITVMAAIGGYAIAGSLLTLRAASALEKSRQ